MAPSAPAAYESPAIRDLGTLTEMTRSMSPGAGPLLPGQLVLAQLSVPFNEPGPSEELETPLAQHPITGFPAGLVATAGAALAGAGLAVRRAIERRSR